jgi:hypothetical protein
MNKIAKVHSSFPQPASYDRKVYLTLSSLLTAPGAVALTRQLPTGLQGACNGCQKTLHVSHGALVPLSISPGRRSMVRDLGACKRLARCTEFGWQLHAITVYVRHQVVSMPQRLRLTAKSLQYASSPTACNTPLHQDSASKGSKISQPPHPLSHVK